MPEVIRVKRGRRPSGARNWVGKKKSEQKKVPRRLDEYHQFCTWSNFSLSCRSFCLSLPLSTPPKLFLMFSTFTIYSKDILRKQFSQKSFSEKKKKIKKNYSFFVFFEFFFFRFFFFKKNLLNTFFSILL